MEAFGHSVRIPDFWQADAVRSLAEGKDLVLHAPTGAGKTYVFERFFTDSFHGNAVYTVPTRALANDKFREWRARGWNVGIATGDYAFNTEAPLVVATLETQKTRIINGRTPALFVIDEYQLLGDPQRGSNYETAIAMMPKDTQLLFLSGSVANRLDVLNWLKRLGRDAVLVEHTDRPVPLEEIHSENLLKSGGVFSSSLWPELVKKITEADMAPVLIFAPRRGDAENIAHRIADEFKKKCPAENFPGKTRQGGAQAFLPFETPGGLSPQRFDGVPA